METDYTDGLALRSLKLIFENLPAAYEQGAKAPRARENMANAAKVSVKMGTFSQYDHPHTLSRYAEVADCLKLDGNTDEEKEYATLASTQVKSAARKSAKTVKDQISANAPSRTGAYKGAGWRPNSPNPARAFRWWCIPRTATSWRICWKKVMPSEAADGWQEDPISLRQSRPASSSSSPSSKRH